MPSIGEIPGPSEPVVTESEQVSYAPHAARRRVDAGKYAVLAAAGLLLAIGLVSIAASLLPFTFAEAQIVRFGGMRTAASTHFNEAVFQGVVARARLGGVVLIAAAVVLFLARKWIRAYLSSVLLDVPLLSADLAQRARRFVVGERRIHLAALAVIIVCGAVVRYAFLFQPIRYDEANTFLGSASVPLYIGLSKYLNNNNHLLNTFWIHISYLAFGDAVWAIRLPAFLAGILIIPVSYATARAFFGKNVALVTAGLVAASSTLIEFSTNARGYTMLCCLWLVVLWLAVYVLRNPRPAAFLLMGLVAALGFYAMPIMLYPFGIVMLWLVLLAIWPGGSADERPRISNLLITIGAAGLTTLILYTPVFVVSGIATVVANPDLGPWRTENSLEVLTRLPGSLQTLWGFWTRDVPVPLQIVLMVGFVTSIVFARRLSSVRVPLIVPVVLWLVAVLMAQRVVPYERVWLFLLPLYLAMAVAGLGFLVSRLAANAEPLRRQTPAIAGGLAVLAAVSLSAIGLRTQSVYYSDETGTLRDAQNITLFLRDNLQSGDRVLATGTTAAPMYYYFRRWHIPYDYFFDSDPRPEDLKGKLFVIVGESSNRYQTLDMPLHDVGLQTNVDQESVLVHDYDTADLDVLRADQLQYEAGLDQPQLNRAPE